jgi:iron complex outermembrane receptor protein
MVSIIRLRSKLLVCTGLAAIGIMPGQVLAQQLPNPAPASASQPATEPASANEPSASDIIVTARRSEERLQDVPESVQAISGRALQDLAITSADEISKLAPGLTLNNDAANTEVTLRGVTWRPGSGTPATPIYYNEVPFDPAQTIVSLFDVGQIEVLRGPQGTSRGAPSISGAVTIATTKPNLEQWGGFIQGQYGEGRHKDLQAGFNVPIIKDVLAIRFATNIENSEGNRVFSVSSPVRPFVRDRSYRATVLFKPTDTVTIEAMYQRRVTNQDQYDQVVGTGSPGAAASPLAAFGLGLGAVPANFNGPSLTLAQRASVEQGGNLSDQHITLITLNANWEVLGHNLTYNFGRQINTSPPSYNAQDPMNILASPGFEPYSSPSNVGGTPFFQTQELRLSSERNPDRPFDYDIGWFSKHSSATIDNSSPSYLSGAFGPPTAAPGTFTTPNPAYVLPVTSIIGIGQVFDSFYEDVKFHIDHNTELTIGGAIIRDRVPVSLNVAVGSGLSVAAPLGVLYGELAPYFGTGGPLAGLTEPTTCAGLGPFAGATFQNSTYPGYCDAVVAAGTGAPPFQSTNKVYSKALYNVSLSHKFSDDVLVYATTGSSYRSGLPALGNVGLPANLFLPQPETAKSYEVGVKTTWGRRLSANASIFQLDYKNQLTSLEGVPYFDSVKSTIDNGGVAFYGNADSRVRGFEVEIAAQPTRELSLGLNLAYSQIKSKGGTLPGFGSAALTAANPINYINLRAGQVLNQEAPFSATANGSYTVPLGPVSGYFRFNLDFKGNNPNFGNFPNAAGVYKNTPAYAILDLFAGITGEKGAWNLGVFAKNVTNKQVEINRVALQNNIYSPYAGLVGGYDQVDVSLPREVGVLVRYSFGSR